MTQWSALLLTLCVEVPIVLFWVRRTEPQQFDWRRVAAVAAAATLLTHPLVWHTNNALVAWPFAARAAVVETFAVVAEAVIYWRFLGHSPPRAGMLSLVANGLSFSIGLAVWALI